MIFKMIYAFFNLVYLVYFLILNLFDNLYTSLLISHSVLL